MMPTPAGIKKTARYEMSTSAIGLTYLESLSEQISEARSRNIPTTAPGTGSEKNFSRVIPMIRYVRRRTNPIITVNT